MTLLMPRWRINLLMIFYPFSVLSFVVTFLLYLDPEVPFYRKSLPSDGKKNFPFSHDLTLLLAKMSSSKAGDGQDESTRELTRALRDGVDGTNATFCPKVQVGLVGRNDILREHLAFPDLERVFPDMKGRYEPTHCRARQRVAIIAPYRNSEQALRVLTHNLVALLQRQMLDFTIFVIEQMAPSRFNRALLFNIGFVEASQLREYDCFVFHDLDFVPVDDHVPFTCGDQPKHLAVTVEDQSGNQQNSGSSQVAEGVMLFTRPQYLRINGASNLYFGIEGHDIDLWKRVHAKNMSPSRWPNALGLYSRTRHNIYTDEEEKRARIKDQLLRDSVKRMAKDGLGSLVYRTVKTRTHKLFIWIQVIVDQSLIQQRAREAKKKD